MLDSQPPTNSLMEGCRARGDFSRTKSVKKIQVKGATMKIRKLFLALILVLISGFALAKSSKSIYRKGWIDLNKNGKMDPYENPALPIEKRIDDLLSRMTLDEKTCQMATLYGYSKVAKDQLPTPAWKQAVWKDGIANIDEHLSGDTRHDFPQTPYAWPPSKHAWALNQVQKFFIEETRLGIPVDFTNEGIHGVKNIGTTCFPDPPGLGSTWDVALLSQIGHVTGQEARALGYTNIYAPILDMARDPRWGRVVENFSEDPYLTSQLAVAMSRGMQAEHIVSTPKHFAVYGVPEGGRDGRARTAPHVTPRELETLYLTPFRAVFTRAHALGVMSSYNDYDGVPVTGSPFFLTTLLRQRWGFRGYVVSDSRAVKFLWSKHHVASSYKEAVRQAVQAGLNVRTDFTPPSDFILPLRELVREGKISMKTIDARVRDVLRVKFWLSLFDHPYNTHLKKSDKIVHSKEHVALSLQASREEIVLLKNENHVLPLRKDLKTILVTGPNANEAHRVSGKYGTVDVTLTTVLEGIREKVSSQTRVLYTKGCDIVDKNWPQSELFPTSPTGEAAAEIQKAASLAKQAEVAVVVVGENTRIVGESRSRTSLNLPGFQRNLVQAVAATGTPTVVVLLNGRALTINWIAQNIPAILEAWFPGEKGGDAVADVLFGDYNPGGKLPVTFPKTVGEIPMAFPHAPFSWAKGGTRISGVLFPFGFGLSYTRFQYANLKITPAKQGPEGRIHVSADITNKGSREGDEVVQLYVNDVVSSVITPEKVLRGFCRIHLKPGETRRVTFVLKPDDLTLLDRHMEWRVEPGRFDVLLGSSSEDIRLKGSFEITP